MVNLREISDIDVSLINRQNEECIKLPINTMVNIHIDDIWKLGHGCGVYVLINKLGEAYVGSSKNIKNRLSSHRSNQNFGQLEFATIFATVDMKEARDIEAFLIKEMQPDLNRYKYTDPHTILKYTIRNLLRYSRN